MLFRYTAATQNLTANKVQQYAYFKWFFSNSSVKRLFLSSEQYEYPIVIHGKYNIYIANY